LDKHGNKKGYNGFHALILEKAIYGFWSYCGMGDLFKQAFFGPYFYLKKEKEF
jgi:hypothetical protein